MTVQDIKPDVLRLHLVEAAAKEAVKVETKATEERRKEAQVGPEKDAILGLVPPTKKKPTKAELQQFYQLLAALSMMYRVQMKGFDSTLSVLQVQGNIVDEMAHKVSSYTKQVADIQALIQKEAAQNPWWKQLLIGVGMLILSTVVTVASAGTGAAIFGFAVGAIVLMASTIPLDKDGKTGMDYLTIGVDKLAEAIKGKKLTDDEQKWINFGFKLGFALVVALATAGTSAAIASRQIASTAATAVEETAAAVGKTATTGAAGAAGAAAAAATRAAATTTTTAVRTTTTLAESAAKEVSKSFFARAGAAAARRFAPVASFMSSPKGIALRVFVTQFNDMLEKLKSEEKIDGVTVKQATVFDVMGDAKGYVRGFLTATVGILNFIAGVSGSGDGKLSIVGQAIQKGYPLLNGVQAVSSVSINAKQAMVAATLGELYLDFARVRAAATHSQGVVTTTQNSQQLLDETLTRELGQVTQRAESVFALQKAMNRAMAGLYRG